MLASLVKSQCWVLDLRDGSRPRRWHAPALLSDGVRHERLASTLKHDTSQSFGASEGEHAGLGFPRTQRGRCSVHSLRLLDVLARTRPSTYLSVLPVTELEVYIGSLSPPTYHCECAGVAPWLSWSPVPLRPQPQPHRSTSTALQIDISERKETYGHDLWCETRRVIILT